MKSLKLRPKTIIAFLAISIIPSLIISFSALTQSSSALKDQAFNQLISLRDSKKEFVLDFFGNTDKQLISLSRSQMIIDAMNQMKNAFKSYQFERGFEDADIQQMRRELVEYYQSAFTPVFREKNHGNDPDIKAKIAMLDENAVAIQHAFIRENPNPIGKKDLMESPAGFSTYGLMHKKVHASIREYYDKFGFSDIFLIEIENGNIVYSVAKEIDFGTSLINGPFADSALGAAFRECKTITDKDRFIVSDYSAYTPSYNDPVNFFTMPVYQGDQMIGVLAFQLTSEKLNKIMGIRVGLGETGETYLIGSDKLMRSDSVRHPETHSVVASFHNPKTGKIETVASQAVLNGETNTMIIKDSDGDTVLSAFTPIQYANLNWGLLTEIDEKEAFSAVGQLQVVITIILALIIILSVAVAIFFANSIVSPLKSLAESLISVGSNVDFSHRVKAKSEDEIGQAALAFNSLVESLQDAMGEIIRMMEKIAKGDLSEKLSINQKGDILKLNTAINNSIDLLGSTFSQITDSSEQVTHSSSQLASSAQTLADGSSQQAASIEETSSSLTEIESQTKSNSDNANQAKRLTNETLGIVAKSDEQMNEMLSSMNAINATSADMAKIIKVIDDIAFQTNLLALNAAVEAARAGQYGKGFAVVAEEVRNLAQRSAEAAKNTTDLIENSQRQVNNGTKNADKTAEMLKEVTASITKINDSVTEIALASEAQTKGISEINVGMSEVNRIVQQNSSISEETSSAAEELLSQSNRMLDLIGQFKLNQRQVTDYATDDALVIYGQED